MRAPPRAKDVIPTTWDHKGITITFSPGRAQFEATAGGKDLRAPSLDAIKAKIDKLNVGSFEPFDAYVEFGGHGTPPAAVIVEKFGNYDRSRRGPFDYLVKVRVVALDTSEGRTRFRYELPGVNDPRARIQRGSEQELGDVHPATPEVIELWKAKEAAQFAKDKADAELGEKAIEARDAFNKLEITAATYRAVK